MGGGWSQREIDDAKWHAEAARGFLADHFAGAGDLEGHALDEFGEFVKWQVVAAFYGVQNNAWPADADGKAAFAFTDAVKRTCHEWVVFHSVAECDKFGASKGILIGCKLGGFLDDAA